METINLSDMNTTEELLKKLKDLEERSESRNYMLKELLKRDGVTLFHCPDASPYMHRLIDWFFRDSGLIKEITEKAKMLRDMYFRATVGKHIHRKIVAGALVYVASYILNLPKIPHYSYNYLQKNKKYVKRNGKNVVFGKYITRHITQFDIWYFIGCGGPTLRYKSFGRLLQLISFLRENYNILEKIDKNGGKQMEIEEKVLKWFEKLPDTEVRESFIEIRDYHVNDIMSPIDGKTRELYKEYREYMNPENPDRVKILKNILRFMNFILVENSRRCWEKEEKLDVVSKIAEEDNVEDLGDYGIFIKSGENKIKDRIKRILH